MKTYTLVPQSYIVTDGDNNEYRVTAYPTYLEISNCKGTKVRDLIYKDDPRFAALKAQLP